VYIYSAAQKMHVSAPGRNTFIHQQPELTIIEYSFHEGKNKESKLISSSLVHHQYTKDGEVERYVKFLSSPLCTEVEFYRRNIDKRRLTQVDDERPAKRARQ